MVTLSFLLQVNLLLIYENGVKSVLIEKTLPGSSGVFNIDGSMTALLISPTGVLGLFSLMTDLCFFSIAGVLYISEIPGNRTYKMLLQAQYFKIWLKLTLDNYQ